MYFDKTVPDFRVNGKCIKEMSAAVFFRKIWEAVKLVPEGKAAIDTFDYVNVTDLAYLLPGCDNIRFTTEIEPGGSEGVYLDIGVCYALDGESEIKLYLATVKTLDDGAGGFMNMGIAAGLWLYYANAAYNYSFDW